MSFNGSLGLDLTNIFVTVVGAPLSLVALGVCYMTRPPPSRTTSGTARTVRKVVAIATLIGAMLTVLAFGASSILHEEAIGRIESRDAFSTFFDWAEVAFSCAGWGFVGTLVGAVGLVVTPSEGSPSEWTFWKLLVNRIGALTIGCWIGAVVFFWLIPH